MTDNKKILDEFDRKLDQELIDKHGTACNPVLVNGCFCKLQNTKERLKSFLLSALEAKDKERLNEIEELEEWVEEEKMNLELLMMARMNGHFKRLNEKQAIGWNKALCGVIAHLQDLKKRV
jgi:hypothetical protein